MSHLWACFLGFKMELGVGCQLRITARIRGGFSQGLGRLFKSEINLELPLVGLMFKEKCGRRCKLLILGKFHPARFLSYPFKQQRLVTFCRCFAFFLQQTVYACASFQERPLVDQAVGQNPEAWKTSTPGGKWMFIHPKMGSP